MWAMILAGLKAVAAAFGFAEKATAEVHDSEQRRAGQDAQKVSVQDASLESLKRQQQASVDGPKTGEDAERRLREGKL